MRGAERDVEGALVGQELPDPPLAVVAPRLQHDPDPRPPRLVTNGRVEAEHTPSPRTAEHGPRGQLVADTGLEDAKTRQALGQSGRCRHQPEHQVFDAQ